MTNPNYIDDQIQELENELKRLRDQKEHIDRRAKVLTEVVEFIDSKLEESDLSISDLLSMYEKEVAKYQSANPVSKRGRKKSSGGSKPAAASGAASGAVKSLVTIPGLGHYQIASRGKLPDALKVYMEQNDYSRQDIIDKFGD